MDKRHQKSVTTITTRCRTRKDLSDSDVLDCSSNKQLKAALNCKSRSELVEASLNCKTKS